MTNTDKKKLEKALNHIQHCNGDCKHCKNCEVVTSKNCLCYAFVCNVYGINNYFTAISDNMKTLKNDMLEAIQFELS